MGRKSDTHCSFHLVKSLFFRMNFLFLSRKSILFNRHKLPKEIMTCDTKPDRLLRTAEPVLLATSKRQPLPLAVETSSHPHNFLSPSYFIKSWCDNQPPVKQGLATHWFDAAAVIRAGELNSYSRKVALAQPGDAELPLSQGNSVD